MVISSHELSKQTATYFNDKFKKRRLILSEINTETGDIEKSAGIIITKAQAQIFIDYEIYPMVCESTKELYFT
jgi:hypothetical protein